MDFSFLANVLTLLTTGIACVTGIYALHAWKKEYIGRKKIDLAEETLAMFYMAKDAISAIRNPFSRADEGNSRERSSSETEEQTKILDEAHIVFERYQKHKETINQLLSKRFKFMALFGIDKEKYFLEWNNIISEILRAGYLLGNVYWRRQGKVQTNESEFKKHLAEMEKQEGIFWEIGGDDDVILRRIDKLVSDFDKVCRVIIRDSMPGVSWITKMLHGLSGLLTNNRTE